MGPKKNKAKCQRTWKKNIKLKHLTSLVKYLCVKGNHQKSLTKEVSQASFKKKKGEVNIKLVHFNLGTLNLWTLSSCDVWTCSTLQTCTYVSLSGPTPGNGVPMCWRFVGLRVTTLADWLAGWLQPTWGLLRTHIAHWYPTVNDPVLAAILPWSHIYTHLQSHAHTHTGASVLERGVDQQTSLSKHKHSANCSQASRQVHRLMHTLKNSTYRSICVF